MQKRKDSKGSFLSLCQKSLAEFRRRSGEIKSDHFRARRVRARKYFSGCKRRTTRRAADCKPFCQKRRSAFFDKLRGRIRRNPSSFMCLTGFVNHMGSEAPGKSEGSRTVISVPMPSVLLTDRRPPWYSTACFTMDSPRPVPPVALERLLSTR